MKCYVTVTVDAGHLTSLWTQSFRRSRVFHRTQNKSFIQIMFDFGVCSIFDSKPAWTSPFLGNSLIRHLLIHTSLSRVNTYETVKKSTNSRSSELDREQSWSLTECYFRHSGKACFSFKIQICLAVSSNPMSYSHALPFGLLFTTARSIQRLSNGFNLIIRLSYESLCPSVCLGWAIRFTQFFF
jgi:hypothetical protein